MGIYDDAKNNLTLVAAVAIASFAAAWAAFEGYSKLSGVDRVPANSYVLVKDLQDKYVARAECEKATSLLKDEVAKLSNAGQGLASCPSELKAWQANQDQWKKAAESLQTNFNNARQNCSLLIEVQRLEGQHRELERDARILSSSGVNGNPSDGINKNNQVKLEITQRAMAELNLRTLEVSKRLTCQP